MRTKFVVPGKPIALERGRHGNGNVYTPSRSLKYQEFIWNCALQAGLRQDCFGDRPVYLRTVAYFAKPVTKNALAKVKAYPTGKPDRDNIDKQVMDALRPAWVDDAQVVMGGVTKYWGSDERLEIEVHDELQKV